MIRDSAPVVRMAIAMLALAVAWALTLANAVVTFEPDLLAEDVRPFLDPSVEFGPANAVSAGLFALLAAVAGWNALAAAGGHGYRRRQVLGWTGFALLALGLAIDELTDAPQHPERSHSR